MDKFRIFSGVRNRYLPRIAPVTSGSEGDVSPDPAYYFLSDAGYRIEIINGSEPSIAPSEHDDSRGPLRADERERLEGFPGSAVDVYPGSFHGTSSD